MEFRAIQKETVVLNPKKDMARRSIPSEIRFDPLTGRSARICHFMKLQWEKPDFEKMVAGTDAWCPFCPDKVMDVTPAFPEEILPEGRMVFEDMVLFPNIAPYDSLGAVATMAGRHYIPMTEFTTERMAKAFGLAMNFFDGCEISTTRSRFTMSLIGTICRCPAVRSSIPICRYLPRPRPRI